MTRQNAMKRQEKWWKNWRKETPNWSPSSVCRLLWFSAESLGQNTAPAPGQNKHTRLTNITTEDTSVNDFLARPFVGQERATPPNGIARQKWPPDRLVSLRRYWTTTKPTIKTQYTIKSRTDFGQSGQTLLLDVPDELLGTEVQHFLNVQFGHVDADRDAGTVGGGQRRFVFRDRAAGSGGRGPPPTTRSGHSSRRGPSRRFSSGAGSAGRHSVRIHGARRSPPRPHFPEQSNPVVISGPLFRRINPLTSVRWTWHVYAGVFSTMCWPSSPNAKARESEDRVLCSYLHYRFFLWKVFGQKAEAGSKF